MEHSQWIAVAIFSIGWLVWLAWLDRVAKSN